MCIMTVSLFPVRSQKSTTPEKPGERPDPAVIYEEKRIFFHPNSCPTELWNKLTLALEKLL